MQTSSPRPANRMLPWLVAGLGGTCVLVACCAGLVGLVPVIAKWVPAAGLTESGPGSGDTPTGNRVGDYAPDFTLEQVEGGQVSLSQFRGQPVLVNFWTTWCRYCLAEMPLIQAGYEQFGGRLVVLAIDEGESLEWVSDFVRQEGYPFPVLLDSDLSVGGLYRVNGYPISYFIDGDGIIRYVAAGEMSEFQMKNGLMAIGIGE